jgi:FHS family L-fucose permease-like MFS transporter
LIVLTSLFFRWALNTSLNYILIPYLKALFELTYFEAMLIQFCFFGAYFVMSFPSGYLVEKVGYRKGIIIGLLVEGAGCAGFYPAASQHVYAYFLLSLFVLASGITLLQVAANPYVAILGAPETAASRLNLTQAFNSLGTTVGPYVGSALILSLVATAHDASAVQLPYLILAGSLVAIALVFAQFHLPTVTAESAPGQAPSGAASTDSVWRHRSLVLGAIAIFVYVGAEVTIGSFLVNYFSQPDIGALPEKVAGSYVSLYWGGAMIGRFIGSAVLRRVKPGALLAFNAACAIALLLITMMTHGKLAMYSVLAVGLFNSIMFPTIFTLGIAHLGRHTGEGSGVLCMAIIGGAIVPLMSGYLADRSSIAVAFILPVICYGYIVYYGLRGHVERNARAA